MSAKGASTMTLLASGLPGFLPAFVADAIAQSQHGIDIAAFPPHPAAFQAGLNHQLVGTLHHAGPDGPACLSEERILHQGKPFAQITQVLAHLFPVDFVLRQAICQAEQSRGTTMFEDVATAMEEVRGKDVPRSPQRLHQLAEMFSCMGKIENPHGILAMDVDECLQPIGSIHDRTDLFGLDELSPARLGFSQIDEVDGIGQARKIREVPDMDLLKISGVCGNLSDCQGADFCPFSTDQGHHGSIGTDGQATGVLSLVCLFLPRQVRFGSLLLLDSAADFFAQPTSRLPADMDSQEIGQHLAGMAKRHPTGQLHEVPLLARGQSAGK